MPRRLDWSLTVSILILFLIAVSTDSLSPVDEPAERIAFVAVVFFSMAGCIATIYLAFSPTQLFTLSITAFLSLYTCIYGLIVSVNFQGIGFWPLLVGYPVPVAAFVLSIWRRRHHIRTAVAARSEDIGPNTPITPWWLPAYVVVGIATFTIPSFGFAENELNWVFVASMAAIASIVVFSSRDSIVVLLSTGRVFENLFGRLARIAVPTFAFLTLYLINVIVFGAVYRLLGQWGNQAHFAVEGTPQTLSFTDSIYFSVVTLSTVGYGSIVPISDTAKMIVAVQIVFGAVLVLVGLSEILAYTRDRRHAHDHKEGQGPDA